MLMSNGVNTRPSSYPPARPLPEKEWTVLYVFNGDNDLKENTSHQFMDVVKTGAPTDSYVAGFCARGDLEWAPGNVTRKLHHSLSRLFRGKKQAEVPQPWEGNRVFEVSPEGGWSDPVASPEGEVSDKSTISDFLRWGIRSFPSRKVAVIFSTHGDGHNGVLMDGRGREMSLPDLRESLEVAKAEHGGELDLVGFESCNMAQTEVAYELHDVARAMVASPTVLTGTPWEHDDVLGAISGAASGLEAATRLVEKAKTSFGSGTPSISAVNLDEMPGFKKLLDRFSKELLESDIRESVLERAIYGARSYSRAVQGYTKPQRELIDLYGFCGELLQNSQVPRGPAVETASKIQESLKQVVPNFMDRQSNYGEGHGLSIFTPTMRGLFKPLGSDYPELKMSLEGDWDDFIAER